MEGGIIRASPEVRTTYTGIKQYSTEVGTSQADNTHLQDEWISTNLGARDVRADIIGTEWLTERMDRWMNEWMDLDKASMIVICKNCLHGFYLSQVPEPWLET